MKKIFMISMFLLMVLAVSCIAAPVTVDKSEIVIGSDSTMRSNPDADEDEDQVVYKETTFKITNKVNDTVTITDITFPTESKYNISVSDSSFTLDPANSTGTKEKTITIRSIIPADLPSFFEDDPDEEMDDIGDVVVKSSVGGVPQDSVTVPLYLQAENFLDIAKVYIKINDGSKKTYEDGETVEKLKPGDIIKIYVKAENKYKDSDPENLDFQDAEIKVECDDEIDIDESEEQDIDADSSEEIEIEEIEIEDDVEDGTYDVVFTLIGEDDNDAVQGEQITIEFEVDKEKDDIAIREFDSAVELFCTDSSFSISFTLKNVGSSDQDEVKVKVSSIPFEFSEIKEDIELEEGDEEEFTFYITIPEGITSGYKNIEITSYYDRTEESHKEYITVNVPECGVTPPPVVDEEEEEEEPEVVIIETEEDEEEDDLVIAGDDIVETVEPTISGGVYLGVLVVAVVIALVCIVVLIVVLAKGRKPKL